MARAVGPRQAPLALAPEMPEHCPRCDARVWEDTDGWYCWCGWHNWHYATEHLGWFGRRMSAPRGREYGD